MSRIRGKDTSIEVKLRKALWHKGIRYRKNCKDVFGRPDICIKSKKIAIFCDSEFWHGKLYKEGKSIPKKNREFWTEKLEKNIMRDHDVNEKLKKDGWKVLRFWQKDIEKNLEKCVSEVLDVLKNT